MKNNINKLISFFSTPNSRCRGDYSRNGRKCLLGALGDLLSVQDARETKQFLMSKLDTFIFDYNRRETKKLDVSNINLATFNDAVDDKTVMEFLHVSKNSL